MTGGSVCSPKGFDGARRVYDLANGLKLKGIGRGDIIKYGVKRALVIKINVETNRMWTLRRLPEGIEWASRNFWVNGDKLKSDNEISRTNSPIDYSPKTYISNNLDREIHSERDTLLRGVGL